MVSVLIAAGCGVAVVVIVLQGWHISDQRNEIADLRHDLHVETARSPWPR